MSSKSKSNFLLLLSAITLIIIIGGLFLGKYFSYNPERSRRASVSSTHALESTANWKTYINTKYGFSFKYPDKNLKVLNDSEAEYSKRTKIEVPGGFTEFMGYKPPRLLIAVQVLEELPKGVISANDNIFRVWIFDNTSNEDIDLWYKKYWYYPFNWGKATESNIESNSPKNKLLIDGLQGRYTVRDEMGSFQYTYISLKGKMYIFVGVENLGNQILSTFRFL